MYQFQDGALSYLLVKGTQVLTATSVTPLYSSATWYWPDAVVVNAAQTLAYVLDGGPLHGYAGGNSLGSVYQVDLTNAFNQPGKGSANATTLYSSKALLLRGGLQLTANESTLLFLTRSSLNSLVVTPPPSTDTRSSLCLLIYSTPGAVDYPWSSTISLSFTYRPTTVVTQYGTGFVLTSGSGIRTYTNRFGTSFSTSITLNTSVPSTGPVLYLNNNDLAPAHLDSVGLTFELATPIQQPGNVVNRSTTQLNVYSLNGSVVIERGSSPIDPQGEAFRSPLSGFRNLSINGADINELPGSAFPCLAAINFLNGLTAPTQPSIRNSGSTINYRYNISDGRTYRVEGNLTLTASSAFATTRDSLGNPYQTIVAVSGTRKYTYLLTGQTLTSAVGTPTSADIAQLKASQRWYPYSLVGSLAGTYTVDDVPYLDVQGLAFTVTPSVPVNGIWGGLLYPTVSVLVNSTDPLAHPVLSEVRTPGVRRPLLDLQRQNVTFRV